MMWIKKWKETSRVPAKRTLRLPEQNEPFGKWTVVDPGPITCVCMCACGTEKEVITKHLLSGRSLSCRKCGSSKPWTDVGKQFVDVPRDVLEKLRRAVGDANRRCRNKHHRCYENWGGRGIEVRFSSDVDFITHLLTLPGYDDFSLILDRIDNDGHYEVGNLRFTTYLESANNQRHSAPTIMTEDRVAEAAELRKNNPKVWTYARLGERYGASASAVFLALKRASNELSSGDHLVL